MAESILERACVASTAVLAAVTPDHLQQASNLPDWDVAELVNHLVGCASFFADVAEFGEVPEDRDWPDYAAGDFLDAFAIESSRVLAAFGADGALEREMMLPIGWTSGKRTLLVATGEIFMHGWDVAKSTGQTTSLDATVAEELSASWWAEISDTLREGDYRPFGPPVPVADTAPPADRLAGFLGRKP